MKQPPLFTLSPAQQEHMRSELRAYFLDELDLEVGDLQLNLFIDFLLEKIGKEFYNVGVQDTIKQLKDKTDDLLLLLKE